jgi:hypothetical protein
METIDIWGIDEGIEKVIIHGVRLKFIIHSEDTTFAR